jgi:hypothetical protein
MSDRMGDNSTSDSTGDREERTNDDRRPYSRQERLRIVDGMLCIVLVLVVMQLWLLTATMNAWLGGDDSVVWPAALASLFCFGLCAGLLRYLHRIDR